MTQSYSDINISHIYFCELNQTDIGRVSVVRYHGKKFIIQTDIVNSPYCVFEEGESKYWLLLQIDPDSRFHNFLLNLDNRVIDEIKNENWFPDCKQFCFISSATSTSVGPLLKVKVPHRYSNFEVKVTDLSGRLCTIDDIANKKVKATLELKSFWLIDNKIGPQWVLKEVEVQI